MWHLKKIGVGAFSLLLCVVSFAQTAPSVVISPTAPSSADTITMRIERGTVPVQYLANSYRVSQESNRLRVTLGAIGPFPLLPPIRPPIVPGALFTFVELGKLPAGNYQLDVVAPGANNVGEFAIVTGLSLVVSDARALKTAPYVRLNYADHWWNPAESGWGLFIWHDKLDRVLAAWFTYGRDNRAEWYSIQAGRWVSFNIYEGQVIKTTGPGFSTFVPGSTVQTQVVGTATLNFIDANNGTFAYTLNGVTQTKNITRFKP